MKNSDEPIHVSLGMFLNAHQFTVVISFQAGRAKKRNFCLEWINGSNFMVGQTDSKKSQADVTADFELVIRTSGIHIMDVFVLEHTHVYSLQPTAVCMHSNFVTVLS